MSEVNNFYFILFWKPTKNNLVVKTTIGLSILWANQIQTNPTNYSIEKDNFAWTIFTR